MARPTDWNILDLDHDPTPGDPGRVKDIGGRMRDIADDAERAARDVRGLAGDDAVMNWIGASGDAFKTHIGKFPSQLDKVANSHHLCADALLEFGNTLDSVQSQADRALVQARPLHDQVQRLQAQLASAHTDLTSAGKGVTAAQAAATVDPTSVQNAIRTQSTAQSAVDSLNSQLSGPASQLEALKKLAASAESLRHTAEDTARTKINAATDAGIPPDSFWHKLGHLAGELWHGLVIVAKIVSFVGAIVLMVVGGPVWLIVAVVVAGVIILADTLYKYSQGKASLWDVGLAALSCIPITKGITTVAALRDAFEAGGLLGAGLHLGGAVIGTAKNAITGMASLLRGGLGRVTEIGSAAGEADTWLAKVGRLNPDHLHDIPGRPGFSLMVPGKAADVFAPNAFKAAELAGHYDVIGHGYLDAIKVGDIGKIDAKALAKAIQARPDYVPGTPIRLLSCNTGIPGESTFARNLARELDVTVLAPNNLVWADPLGHLGVGPRDSGYAIPDMIGKFTRYHPSGFLEKDLGREIWEGLGA